MKGHKKSSNMGVKITAVLLIIAAIVLYVTLELSDAPNGLGQAYFEDTGVGVSHTRGEGVFHANPLSNGFFFSDRQGVQFITGNNNVLLNEAFTVPFPEILSRGAFTAVLETGGRSAWVYSQNELIYHVSVGSPILRGSLGNGGHLCLFLQNGDRFELNVFNPQGEMMLRGDITHDERVPFISDVSHDGQRLAIVYLDTTAGTQLNFIVMFYHLDSDLARGYAALGGVFAANADNLGRFPLMARFMDDGRLITVSDREIRAYAEDGTVHAFIPVNNHIGSRVPAGNHTNSPAAFAGGYFAVALGEGLLNEPSEPYGTVLIFDSGLNLLATHLESDGVSGLTASHDAVLITAGRELTAVNKNGRLLWTRTVAHDVTHAAFLGSTAQILLAGHEEARVYRVVSDH